MTPCPRRGSAVEPEILRGERLYQNRGEKGLEGGTNTVQYPIMLSVLYVDMNSFFASVEQQANPHLRGRPVAVVPVESDSTCCIAASTQAKAFGVRTGTNVGQARRKCPGLVGVHADFQRYVRAHHAVVAATGSA